jgi:hypothetical protein
MSEGLRLAAMLRDLVDVLIPGRDPWPNASLAGVHGVLGMRLLEQRGEAALAELDEALAQAGGPLADKAPADQAAIVAKLEQQAADLFTLVRTATYLAYYENPAVIRVVQALGQPYRAVPARGGYPQGRFDPADRPQHGRGAYIATEAVRRVDLELLEGERDGTA